MEKIGFFEESPGQKSIMRVMFAIMVLNALFILDYQLITTGHMDLAAFISEVTAACTLKLGQKYMEAK